MFRIHKYYILLSILIIKLCKCEINIDFGMRNYCDEPTTYKKSKFRDSFFLVSEDHRFYNCVIDNRGPSRWFFEKNYVTVRKLDPRNLEHQLWALEENRFINLKSGYALKRPWWWFLDLTVDTRKHTNQENTFYDPHTKQIFVSGYPIHVRGNGKLAFGSRSKTYSDKSYKWKLIKLTHMASYYMLSVDTTTPLVLDISRDNMPILAPYNIKRDSQLWILNSDGVLWCPCYRVKLVSRNLGNGSMELSLITIDPSLDWRKTRRQYRKSRCRCFQLPKFNNPFEGLGKEFSSTFFKILHNTMNLTIPLGGWNNLSFPDIDWPKFSFPAICEKKARDLKQMVSHLQYVNNQLQYQHHNDIINLGMGMSKRESEQLSKRSKLRRKQLKYQNLNLWQSMGINHDSRWIIKEDKIILNENGARGYGYPMSSGYMIAGSNISSHTIKPLVLTMSRNNLYSSWLIKTPCYMAEHYPSDEQGNRLYKTGNCFGTRCNGLINTCDSRCNHRYKKMSGYQYNDPLSTLPQAHLSIS